MRARTDFLADRVLSRRAAGPDRLRLEL